MDIWHISGNFLFIKSSQILDKQKRTRNSLDLYGYKEMQKVDMNISVKVLFFT